MSLKELRDKVVKLYEEHGDIYVTMECGCCGDDWHNIGLFINDENPEDKIIVIW